MSSSDLLWAPAVDILLQLKAEGLSFGVTPEGRLRVSPADRLSPESASLIRRYRDELVQLVHVSDPGVQARVEVFRRQIAAARPATAMPSLVFRRVVPDTSDSCFSCGDPVGPERWGRCWRCALAARVAVGEVPRAGTVPFAVPGSVS